MIKRKFNIHYIVVILIGFLFPNLAKGATIDVGGAFTTPVTINSSVTNDYILYPAAANGEGTVNFINKNNVVTGTVKGSVDGVGVINFSAAYDRTVTFFGASGQAIRLADISGGFDIGLNTPSYIDTINMNDTGSKLTILNSLSASSSGVTHITTATNLENEIHVDSVDATLDIGSSGFSLSLVDLLDGTLNLNDRVYVDEILLDDNVTNAILNLNYSSGSIGNIYPIADGEGEVNVLSDVSGTYFSQSNVKVIGALNVKDDATLILDSSTTSYADNLTLYNGATADGAVVLGNNNFEGNIIGENGGDGTVYITTTYTNANTVFGTGSNAIGTININSGGQMTAGGVGYSILHADVLSLTGTFNLDGAALTVIPSTDTIQGETDGSGMLNVNVNYNTSTDPVLGTSGHAIGTLNLAMANTLSINNASHINMLNLVTSSTLNINSGAQLNGTTVKGENATVNVNTDYNTSTFATTLGTSVTTLSTVNVSDTKTLTLANATTSYIGDLNLGAGSTLALGTDSIINGNVNLNGANSSITGTLRGENTILNANVDYTSDSAVTFGTSSSALSRINLSADNTFTLYNDGVAKAAYIDSIDFSNSNDQSLFKIKADSNGYLLDGGFSGFTGNVASIAISLNGDETKAKTLNSMIGSSSSITVTDDTLYFKKINIDTATNGDTFDVDSGLDFTNSVLYSSTNFYSFSLQVTAGNILQILYGGESILNPENLTEAEMTIFTTTRDLMRRGNLNSDQRFMTDELSHLEGNNLKNALSDLLPDISGSFANGFKNTMRAINLNLENHFDSLRIDALNKKNNPILYANNSNNIYPVYFLTNNYPRNIWGKLYFGQNDVDKADDIAGYKSDYYGLTFGYDKKIINNFTLGGTYTYEYTSIENDFLSVNSKDTMDVFNNLIGIYGMYDKSNFHLLSSAFLGFHNYELDRKISFGAFNRIAKSDYNGVSTTFDINVGYDFILNKKYEDNKEIVIHTVKKGETIFCIAKKYDANLIEIIKMNNLEDKSSLNPGEKLKIQRLVPVKIDEAKNKKDNLIKNPFQSLKSTKILTPSFSLSYSHLNPEDYTEGGAGAANLEVNPKSIDILKYSIGVKYIENIIFRKKSSWQKMFKLGISHDILNERPKFRARYVDDNNLFEILGPKPNSVVYNFGVGAGYNFDNFFLANIDYNFDKNKQLESHLFKLNLNWRF